MQYPQAIALTQFLRMVEAKFRIKSGALYFGELESMVLVPLRDTLIETRTNTDNTGLVVKKAFQLAAEYGLIADIAQVSQVKEVARELTATAIVNSPVYAALRGAMQSLNDQGASSLGQSAGSGAQGDGNKNQISDAWKAIDAFLSSKITEGPVVQNAATPLSILLRMQSVIPLEQTVPATWDRLVRHLKEGKGRPLSQASADAQAMLLSSVWHGIASLVDEALSELAAVTPNNPPSTASFADAWTALLWFYMYLDMSDNYDAMFPAAVMQQQSTAWVLALRTQALKYRSLFADLAKAAQSFDVATFMWEWEQQRKFMSPVLPSHQAAVLDMDALWDRLKTIADKEIHSFSADAARETLNSYKEYAGTDIVLPDNVFTRIYSISDDWTIPDPSPTKAGKSFIQESDTLALQDIYSGTRVELLTHLTASAGMLEIVLGYMTRATSLLMGTTLAEASPIVMPAWEPLTKLSGHAGEYTYASFTPTHPVKELMPKYTGEIQNPSALAEDDVMIPKYIIPLMQQRAVSTDLFPDEAKLCWESSATIALDVVSRSYASQPIPALYTWHRASPKVKATISSYEVMMRGQAGLQDCKDTFWSTIANIIVRYRSTYGYSILDLLSACMFVYVSGDLPSSSLTGADDTHTSSNSDKWTWLQPRVPVIYGCPVEYFQKQQRGADKRISAIEKDYRQTVELEWASGKVAKVAFVLHSQYPVVSRPYYFQYPVAPGSYMPVAIASEARVATVKQALGWEKRSSGNQFAVSSMAEFCTTLRTASVKGEIEFKACDYFYPGLIVAPHLLWAWYSSCFLLDDNVYKKSEILKLRVRTNGLTGMMSALSVIDNPIQIVTRDEFDALMNASDPSPIVVRDLESPSEDEGDGKEAQTVPAEPAPSPERMANPPVSVPSDGAGAPSTSADAGAMAAAAGNVSTAPVVEEPDPNAGPDNTARLKDVAPSSVESPFGSTSAQPLAGTPEKPVSAAPAPALTEYWKLVQDGKLVDVIKGSSAPSGYEPATRAEYDEFVKAQKDKSPENDGDNEGK